MTLARTCAVMVVVAAAAGPVAADDRARSVTTVTTITKVEPDLERATTITDAGAIPCVFPPDVSRLRAEAARKVAALVRRCHVASGVVGTATVFLDRGGRLRGPVLAADVPPATAACVESVLRTWTFSRRATAAVYADDPWEPVAIDLHLAVP